MIDLKAINLRLGNKRFLRGAADESFFSHLTTAIQSQARPGENLNVPEYNEQDAWARAYALYEALQRRLPDKQATEAAEAISRDAVAHSRAVNDFANDMAALQEFRDRNRVQWSLLAEYVGLTDEDLIPAPVDPRFGDPVGWSDRAPRVRGALSRLQGMTDVEKREFPAIVEQRRLRAHLHQTESRLEDLERQNAELKQKVTAIESRLISQKEVRDAVAA